MLHNTCKIKYGYFMATTSIQLNSHTSKDQDSNLARITAMKKGITPAMTSTVFVFRNNYGREWGNPALGALDPTLTYQKIGNPKAVQDPKKQLKFRVQPLPKRIGPVEPVASKAVPSVAVEPPRPLTPPPKEPAIPTSAEKLDRAVKILKRFSEDGRQGARIILGLREQNRFEPIGAPPTKRARTHSQANYTQTL
jgi:hypothetical protein